MAYDDDRNRVLLWIAACSFFVIFLASTWYWFYVHYHKTESLRSSLQRADERDNQQAEYGAAQQQGYQSHAAQIGHEGYELETVHHNPQWRTGGDSIATMTVANPPRVAPRNDWGGYNPDQAPRNIFSSLSKEGLGHQSQNHAEDQQAIGLATDGRRHYSVTDSDSSETPQMTPKTGSSAAPTPERQRTPLPRYTLEPCDTYPPIYAESEPGHHASSAPPRRPTF